MINQIDSGATIEYTNGTGSDISSGDLVVVGLMCGVAVADIADGDSGILSIKGKYSLTKKTAADVISQGAILVEDTGVKVISAGTTIVDAVIVGRAAAGSATTVTTVDVVLGL